jgi:hypothetical protein
MKNVLSIILRVLALFVIYSILSTVGSSIATPREAVAMFTPQQVATAAAVMPVVSAIMTIMLSYLALRSRWHGWKLAGSLFLIYFVLQAFLGWIEIFAFPPVATRMPPGMQTSMLMTGFMVGIPFSLVAVWVLGKTRPDPDDARLPRRLVMPPSEWAWKLAAGAVLYVIVYFTFGYYVAWRTPGLPAFYGGSDPGTFLGQLANVLRDTPWLYPFQLARGFIWAGTGCLIIAMHKGRTWEVVLATGLAFTVLMNASMLFPNPFFTPVVQRAHTIELVSSNLLYGILLNLLITWKYGIQKVNAGNRPAAVA